MTFRVAVLMAIGFCGVIIARDTLAQGSSTRYAAPPRRLPAVSLQSLGFPSQAAPGESTKRAGVEVPLAASFATPASFYQAGADDTAPGMLNSDEFLPANQPDGMEMFRGDFSDDGTDRGVGLDLYSPPDFDTGVVVRGENVAMKFGGYVKADFIYDFDPIDSTDSFNPTTIPIGAPHRTNARFHAKQSRFSFDTRWATDVQTVRFFVEGDFFSEGNHYRLRHAYGEVGRLLVGRTWTTFHQTGASPPTLDFEGSVSSVNRRQAQARWTQPLFHEDLKLALAVEDARFIIEEPVGLTGDPRTPSPDFVVRLRLDREWGQFQIANIYRIGAFQPTGGQVITGTGWGFNFSGVANVSQSTDAYYQIVFGDGIGSYRDLPDAAPTAVDAGGVLSTFAWMVGITHNWTEQLSSNFTYAENSVDPTAFQAPEDVQRTTYLAANLIYSPLDRVYVGIEYLYGTLENVAGATGKANRLQTSFVFVLP